MIRVPLPLGLGSFVALVLLADSLAAQPRQQPARPASPAPVRLEIAMEPGLDLGDAHEWARAYGDRGIDVRLRAMKATDDARIENAGNEQRPSWVVIGILTRRNRLQVPGRTFTNAQGADAKEWLDQLAANGPDAIVGERLAFGLTPAQLIALHDDLATEVEFPTIGIASRTLVERLSETIATPLAFDPAAAAALDDSVICEDELQGLTVGTALAAAVRPGGLVLTVRRDEAGSVSLAIVESRRAEEFWPIGWPIEKPPGAVAPVLSDKIKVDIKAFRLGQAIEAIRAKCGLAMLIDRNGLAEQGIELDEVRVSYTHPDAPYGAILSKLLGQTEPPLKYEIRMDERETPFLWIAPR